jgi:hypothetical protein
MNFIHCLLRNQESSHNVGTYLACVLHRAGKNQCTCEPNEVKLFEMYVKCLVGKTRECKLTKMSLIRAQSYIYNYHGRKAIMAQTPHEIIDNHGRKTAMITPQITHTFVAFMVFRRILRS